MVNTHCSATNEPQQLQLPITEVLEPQTQLYFLFFSMQACSSCKEFSQILTELYEDFNYQRGFKRIEVIACYTDLNNPNFSQFFAQHPWPAYAQGDKQILKYVQQIGVQQVPHLVAVDRWGNLLSNDNLVVNIVQEGPKAVNRLIEQASKGFD